MKYHHILSAFAAEPLAMTREKIDEIMAFLMFKADGGKIEDDELAGKVTKKREAEIISAAGNVAVIPVFGTLAQRMDMMTDISGGTSYSGLQKSLHAALSDDNVKVVVLDIDRAGGTVPGADELASEMRRIRGGDKPIIAQVNSMAASAAYWIASSADEIVVTPSGRAGSIGVYTVHDDMSDFLRQKGVKRTYISAGKYKTEGNEAEALPDEARQFIQERVDRSYDRFVRSVAAGRGVSISRVQEGFGQGRVFFAEELIDRGMADRIATMDETLARFGAVVEPEPIRRIKAANAARAEAAELLSMKFRAGEPVTKREFENGLKGLVGCSNSEAERAARLYFKDGQGEPDDSADKAALAAIEKVLATAKSFKA